MKQLGIEPLKDGSYDWEHGDTQFQLEQAIEREWTNLHVELSKLVNPNEEKSLAVRRFKEVVRLKDGFSFGELALLKTAGRAATIECTQATKFATLHRKVYVTTIGQDEKRRLKEIVAFFRSFRMFQNLRASTIERIY